MQFNFVLTNYNSGILNLIKMLKKKKILILIYLLKFIFFKYKMKNITFSYNIIFY